MWGRAPPLDGPDGLWAFSRGRSNPMLTTHWTSMVAHDLTGLDDE